MADESGPFEVVRRAHCASAPDAGRVRGRALRAGNQVNAESVQPPPIAQTVDRTIGQTGPVKSNAKVIALFGCNESGNAEWMPGADDAVDGDSLDTPDRRYDCENYDTCLSLAAALDWHSFSCGGCSGCVNQQLLWRAHNALRRSSAMRRICKLPVLY
ncbi:MAG TPA: hypothetical protein PLP17_04055 [Oligoflexia bacterium]|mgnify:CR=1 FL=1|nr:hypothetical protein [Oligoflexia bacterium]